MKIVVLSESRTGNTHRAAAMIGESARATGAEVVVCSVRHPDLDAIAAADVVFIGTWCDGAIFFGHRPGGGAALRRLPMMHGIRAAAFVTYAYNAGKVAKRFTRLLEGRGMEVIETETLRRDLLPAGVDAFVKRSLEAASTTARA